METQLFQRERLLAASGKWLRSVGSNCRVLAKAIGKLVVVEMVHGVEGLVRWEGRKETCGRVEYKRMGDTCRKVE